MRSAEAAESTPVSAVGTAMQLNEQADLYKSIGTESTSPSPPSSLSEGHVLLCWAALLPTLGVRTSATLWAMPKGPEAYRRVKQLGVVVNHKLNTTWEHDVAPKVLAWLDEMGILWTSTDIVCIGVVGESSAPVILWIRVKPKSLAGEDANTAASRCLDVLKEFSITDVHVENPESFVTWLAGPKLLPPVLSSNPTAAGRDPLTHVLGLPISAEATPYAAGTGGFLMAEGGGSNEFLISAHHVVLLLNKEINVKFECKNKSLPCSNILLFSDKAYESCLASIKARIKEHGIVVEHWELCLKVVEGQDNEEADEECEGEIKVAKKVMEVLYTFYNDVDEHWATYASCVLGHIVYSPPIHLGAGAAAEQYTEDYSIIKVDEGKIDRTKFKGNMIDLGTKIKIWELKEEEFLALGHIILINSQISILVPRSIMLPLNLVLSILPSSTLMIE